MMVRVLETHSGFRAGTYYYVIDGKSLRSISLYASSVTQHDDFIEYEIDQDNLEGKEIVIVSSSTSASTCELVVADADALARGSLIPGNKGVRAEGYSYLNDLDFTFLTDAEKKFVKGEWKEYYVPIIKELKVFLYDVYPQLLEYHNPNAEILRTISLMSRMPISQITNISPLLQCQIKDANTLYPLSYLIPYSDKARQKSLESLTKEMFKLWVLIKIIEEFKDSLDYVNLKINQMTPVAVISKKYSVWYDLDLRPTEICGGKLTRVDSPTIKEYFALFEEYRGKKRNVRAPLKPDITIMEDITSCEDIMRKGLKVRMVIETKNNDIKYWEKEVTALAEPYTETIRSQDIVVVSMRPIKKEVELPVTVIDEVYPNGEGEKKFIEFLHRL